MLARYVPPEHRGVYLARGECIAVLSTGRQTHNDVLLHACQWLADPNNGQRTITAWLLVQNLIGDDAF